jgi:hypothetical protein
MTDFVQGEAQALCGFDEMHQLHHLLRVVAVTIGAALR